MPVGITYEQKVDYMKKSFSRSHNVMYVTTAVAENDAFNSTTNFIKDNFNVRDQTQKETWLMGLELSGGPDIENRCGNNEFVPLANFGKSCN